MRALEAAISNEATLLEGIRSEGKINAEILAQTVIAQATIAIAEEQRTANLIAWAAMGNGGAELHRKIQRRLGL